MCVCVWAGGGRGGKDEYLDGNGDKLSAVSQSLSPPAGTVNAKFKISPPKHLKQE